MAKPSVLTPTAELAAHLGVTPQTVRNWWRAGRIAGMKVGNRLLVDVLSVQPRNGEDHE